MEEYLVRMVKMEFYEENIPVFLENFNQSKDKIRNFDGCQFLELYQDKNNPIIFFTYSYWKSEKHLNAYRDSNLFKGIWAKTKPLFSAKPMAWSVNKKYSLV